ncbi:MAG: hypothetical protein JJ974_04740 [Phycisphaerales bacterium]|nr:hypothetical protein [Phycisphaerales bacterium]
MLEKEFGQPMNQGSRLATALDMQNSPSFPVFEAVDSNDILLQLGFSGCTFFYPRYPDTNLLVRFSPDGSYLGFHRWAIEDDLWRSSGREYASELDEQEGDIESRGHFVTSYFGDRRAYRIVLRNDTVTD